MLIVSVLKLLAGNGQDLEHKQLIKLSSCFIPKVLQFQDVKGRIKYYYMWKMRWEYYVEGWGIRKSSYFSSAARDR